jgi:Ca2+-binding EF-hand superfamily protein
MDDDGSKKLSMDEFQKGINEYGLNFSKADIAELFRTFDTDQNGSIDFDEFLRKLRVGFTI